MRRFLLLCLFALPVLSGAVIGPHGAVIDRALLPLGGALRANAGLTKFDRLVALAAVNYDARDLAVSDGAAVTAWANTGSLGAAWDLDSAYTVGPTYQQAGDCTGSVHPCVVTFDGTGDAIRMDMAATATWTHTLHCVVFTKPEGAGGNVVYQTRAATNDYMLFDAFVSQIVWYGLVAGTALNTTPNALEVVCSDMTTPSAVVSATPTQSVTDNQTGILDPNRISIGRQQSGTSYDCANCEIHQVIAWNTDVGFTAQEAAQVLHAEWGVAP